MGELQASGQSKLHRRAYHKGLKILKLHLLIMCVHTHNNHVEVRVQFSKVWFFFPPCGSQDW